VTADDLPDGHTDQDQLRQALARWRERCHCPDTVELRDDDRTLRLTLDEPVHTAILHAHLKRHGHAILTEAPAEEGEFGWLGHHVHEIALPLVSTRPPAPSPLTGALPLLTNGTLGPLPGCAGAPWLNAKIYTHPDRYEEIITTHLPRLLTALTGAPDWWFVRYRSPHETDHLRLRIRTMGAQQQAAYMSAVGQWSAQLRRDGLASGLAFDTYSPEIGRYGPGAAMWGAEAVFVADSRFTAAVLRHLPAKAVDPMALAAVNMVDIARGFLGPDDAMHWLASHPAPAAIAADRAIADQAVRLARHSTPQSRPGWTGAVIDAWHRRAAALVSYKQQLPEDTDADAVLQSLLHMHHNRLRGINQEGEKTCRRLARQAALAWRAQREGGDQ
jgi:thiopeptide-type bacteriocin biosynthesis protein